MQSFPLLSFPFFGEWTCYRNKRSLDNCAVTWLQITFETSWFVLKAGKMILPHSYWEIVHLSGKRMRETISVAHEHWAFRPIYLFSFVVIVMSVMPKRKKKTNLKNLIILRNGDTLFFLCESCIIMWDRSWPAVMLRWCYASKLASRWIDKKNVFPA